MRLKICLTLVFLVALAGCSNKFQEFKPTRLPSGKEVNVDIVYRHDFPTGQALVVKYRTDLSIDDKVALRKEVDEIWDWSKQDAEEDGLKAGVVHATHVEGILFKSDKGYSFIFLKRDNGTWHCTEDDKVKN